MRHQANPGSVDKNLVAAAAASYESRDPDGRDRNQEDSGDDGRSSYRRRNASELFFQHFDRHFSRMRLEAQRFSALPYDSSDFR